MERPEHNEFWGELIRRRLGDELPAYADQVRELIEHPAWRTLAGLWDDALSREMALLISRRPLEHAKYIAVTRAAFTIEVCRALPHSVLYERQRMLDRQREAAEAAERREEDAR